MALSLKSTGNNEEARIAADKAVTESTVAALLSPFNVNFLRQKAAVYLRLIPVNPQFLPETEKTLLAAINLAPTDAKIYYTLTKVFIQENEIEKAKAALDKTIELKPNYKDARYLKALLLVVEKKYPEAKVELNYIIEKIDPNDENAKIELEKLK